MAPRQSLYRTLTLQASLEEVIHLGKEYLLTEAGEDWRARDLLAWLEQEEPDLLSLPVALVPPDANGDGFVFEVDLKNGAGIPISFEGIGMKAPLPAGSTTFCPLHDALFPVSSLTKRSERGNESVVVFTSGAEVDGNRSHLGAGWHASRLAEAPVRGATGSCAGVDRVS